MEPVAILAVLFRWIHVISACIAIGSIFFMRIILPIGLLQLDPEPRQAVFLRCRRALKMVIHPAILLLLISGIYNSTANWSQYKLNPAGTHSLWGMHMLLAAIVFTISLVMLAGKEPPKSHRKWMMGNLVLLMVVVAIASTLKWVREHPPQRSTPPAVVQQ